MSCQSGRAKFACLLHVRIDLSDERLEIVELSFRPKIAHEANFNVLAVDIAIEVEQINFQHALRPSIAHGWPVTEIDDPMVQDSLNPCLGEINAVWWKLLAVRAEVGSWVTKFFPKLFASFDCAQNHILAAEHYSGRCELALFHGLPDGGATDDRAVHFYRRDSNHMEMKLRAKFLEKIEISAAIFSKLPFVSDANFAQRF